jgi:hypothetical protein
MLASQNGVHAETKVLFRDCPPGAAFYELDLETGTVITANAEKTQDGCLIDAPLCPWSARIFAITDAGEEAETHRANSPALSPVQAYTRPPEKTLRLTLELDRELPVSIAGGNVYRLEELTVSIAGGTAFSSKPNTFINHLKISPSLSPAQIKFGDGFGVPQRLSVSYPQQAAYNFEFILEDTPLQIRLMRDRMGIMGKHSMTLNGRELPSAIWEAFRVYDQNNIVADITPFLKDGHNTLDVYVTAAEDWHGLSDPIYLLGTFGVFKREGKFIIGKAPAAAIPSAKAVEGFPFYRGTFSFEAEFFAENAGGYEHFTVEIPEKYRIYECVELSVNGTFLGVRTFSPYIWQGHASLLKKGSNPVKMIIANTLGNMFEGCYYDYEEQKTVFIQ